MCTQAEIAGTLIPMMTTILIVIISGGILWWLASYSTQKIKWIQKSIVLEVDRADVRYPNLELGCLGIYCEVSQNRRIRVVFPTLTAEGDVKYIYSWHNLKSIRIPALNDASLQHQSQFGAIEQLATLIKEHLQLQLEIIDLTKQWQEINNLLHLIATSVLYASHQEIYARALLQVENLLDKTEQLEQIYLSLIREGLIGFKIVGYNPNFLPDEILIINDQYKRIRQEYEIMKNTASAYAELFSLRKA